MDFFRKTIYVNKSGECIGFVRLTKNNDEYTFENNCDEITGSNIYFVKNINDKLLAVDSGQKVSHKMCFGKELDGIDGFLYKSGGIMYASDIGEAAFNAENVEFADKFETIEIQSVNETIEEQPKVSEIPEFEETQPQNKLRDWKEMFKKYKHFEPFADDEIYSCVKIGFEDLKYLPSSCQSLIDNSFLLHGLYYYGHVLLGKYKCKKREKIYVLAVPGKYSSGEQVIAMMFGFEKYKNAGEHGYWYVLFRDDND